MARKRAVPELENIVPGRAAPPDQVKLNELAAGRLAALAGVDAARLKGQTIASIADKLRWEIDPELLLFRRVCGRVVKTDSVTGIQYPVPFATVHVLDTDCDFWGYFPDRWLFAWLFPIRCRVEELAHVVTDECGNFCVWIPRFEIDWILRWRRERFCFEEFLVKPSIADLLRRLAEEVEIDRPFPPDPNPPDPFRIAEAVAARGDVGALLGRHVQEAVTAAQESATFGASAAPLVERLGAPAFAQGLQPPLPHTLKQHFAEVGHEALAQHLEIESSRLDGIDLHRYHGPFLRCFDIFVREWMPIFEVPDVSFEVKQDVDGDGTEEVIYQSFFDISFGGADPYVTIEASPIAVSLPSPYCGPVLPCNGDVSIQRVGLMPVEGAPTYFNGSTGFAVRPNKKRPGGLFASPESSPSTAPFFGELQLYGCNHYPKAAYYRVLAGFAAGNGLPTPGAFSAPVPMMASWPLARWAPGFQHLNVSPDSSGWYSILADADGWQPEHLLMDWVTSGAGVWQLTLELGDSSKSVIHAATSLTLVVDNDAPTPMFPTMFRWRYASSGGWHTLSPTCPLIQRTMTDDILIEIGANVTAGHLRSARLSAGGCGLTLEATTFDPMAIGDTVTEHWYVAPLDNTWSTVATYRVPAGASPGCYTFYCATNNRAFNPAGWDGGFAADWNYDAGWAPGVTPQISVAIVGP